MKAALTLLLLCLALLWPPTGAADEISAVLVGAGDIASCTTNVDEQTADLVDAIPEAGVFTLGDNVYVNATAWEFANCYGPSWGRFRDRTRPVIGNHEYNVSPQPYFDYFGALAGPCCRGYYRYDVAGWRIYALNSEINTGSASKQYAWLKKKLDLEPHECTIALWHKPRFTSDDDGGWTKMGAMTTLLYQRRAELILSGHVHGYERMARHNPSGAPDPVGVRTIIAGMGGRLAENAADWIAPLPITEFRDNVHAGILRLDLTPGAYTWRFIATDGSIVDQGSDVCLPTPAAKKRRR